jgi:dihydroorotate dehydrogenase (fumarate)
MDLRTTYLGMNLKNPIVPSASPLSRSVTTIRKMEDSGAAAVVLYSLFEEELNHESRTLDRYLTEGTHSYAEALSYFPEAPSYHAIGPDSYLEHIHRAKMASKSPLLPV